MSLVKQALICINLSTGSYKDFISAIIDLAERKSSSYVCIANVHMLVEAYDNPEFANIVNNAGIVTPDGMPLAKGLKFLYGIEQERVAGMDLLPDLLQAAGEKHLKVYFYGSTQEVLDKTITKVKLKFPKVIISGFYSPPFRVLSPAEEKAVTDEINLSGAEIVFVALGCPKQEIWMSNMKGKISAIMLGIGGALPVFADIQRRAPNWVQKLSMEWLFRLLQEPKRLWKRYLYTNSMFLYLFVKELLKLRSKL